MTIRHRCGALLAASTILLAGCASTRAATMTQSTHAGRAITPGMVMQDGSTMGAGTPTPSAALTKPSAAARMICSAEVRSDITKVLALKSVPAPSSTWSHQVYTCTYRLPMGTFTLSVTESSDGAAARAFAAGLRKRLGATHSLAGLTTTAFATPAGTVVVVKDNDTLQVDATRLPAQFGSQHEKRSDFAYEIASDILGCWTGDDS